MFSMNKETLMKDALSSFVVFLVAVPLCLGIAIACGLPPAAGLISGIIGGLVVGSFAGCPLQVSGPAAGLIAIVWDIIEKHGLETFGFVVLMAGVLQVLLGVFKLGRWFRAVSPAVIQGMLAGIGVLIFASQFHIMIDDEPVSSGLDNLMLIPQAVNNVFTVHNAGHQLAALTGVITILAIVGWGFVPKKIRTIPGALIGVAVATIVANLMGFDINYVSVPENLLAEVELLGSDQFENMMMPDVWMSIVALAFIASAEALLTATATDRLADGTKTNYNKEILAQGLGNIAAGFVGALPVTGVIVRSSANVQAGGQTRAATMMHGVWLLIFVIVLPGILGYIPVSSLAAVLVYTGYRLMNPQALKDLKKYGNSEAVIFGITVITIVVAGLLQGIITGFALSAFKLLYTLTHLTVDVEEKETGELEVDIHGSATFFTLPILADILEGIPPNKEVHLYLVDLNYVDHACLELLMEWEQRYESDGGDVVMEWDHVLDRFKSPKTQEREEETPPELVPNR